MSCWWDDDAQRYRSSLPYKIFYVWGWPVARWIMFNCMSKEFAHVFAIKFALPLIGRLDRWYYRLLVVPSIVVLLVVIRLLCFLPGFHCTPPAPEGKL